MKKKTDLVIIYINDAIIYNTKFNIIICLVKIPVTIISDSHLYKRNWLNFYLKIIVLIHQINDSITLCRYNKKIQIKLHIKYIFNMFLLHIIILTNDTFWINLIYKI